MQNKRPPAGNRKEQQRQAREARRAKALRENLKRRKAQLRARADGQKDREPGG